MQDKKNFDELIQKIEHKYQRDNLKAAIFKLSSEEDQRAVSLAASFTAIQSYLLNDPTARRYYIEKLKMQSVMQRIKINIEDDLKARGYTSTFNILLEMAIGDDESQRLLRSKKNWLFVEKIVGRNIAQIYYPQLIGLIQNDKIVVTDKKGMNCKYAFLKQQPDEIKFASFKKLPEVATHYSPQFWQQFDVLNHFFVHIEMNKKIDARRQKNIENIQIILDAMRKQKRTVPTFDDHPFSDAETVISFAERNDLTCPKKDTVVSVMREIIMGWK